MKSRRTDVKWLWTACFALLTCSLACGDSPKAVDRVATLEEAKVRIAALEARVSELEVINQALVKEITDLKAGTVSAVATSRPANTATLKGSIWVTKGSGENQFLAGHNVYLVPRKVKSAAVLTTLKARLKEETDGISRGQKWAADERKRGSETIAKIGDEGVRKAQARQAKLEEAIKALPTDEVDVITVYEAIRGASAFHRPMLEELMASLATFKTEADRDGRYAFTNIVPGEYVIYAEEFRPTIFYLDWAIPVSIKVTQEQSLDLSNKKATAIWNRGDAE